MLNFINFHLFSIVCVSILCFLSAPVSIFLKRNGCERRERDLRSNFYILLRRSDAFSLHFFLSLCFFHLLSPFLSWWQSPKREINFSSWDRMTLACGVCDLVANGSTVLYHCTRVTICCQQPIALSVGRVYELYDWGVFQHLISFFAGQTISACTQVLLTLTNDIVVVPVSSFPLKIHDLKS